jgi:hypothetical protein
MRSARKEAGKFTEGVILSKSMEVVFRAVPPSLYLAMAMTGPEEKHQCHQLLILRSCRPVPGANFLSLPRGSLPLGAGRAKQSRLERPAEPLRSVVQLMLRKYPVSCRPYEPQGARFERHFCLIGQHPTSCRSLFPSSHKHFAVGSVSIPSR